MKILAPSAFAAATLLLPLTFAPPATAGFPGENGRLVFVRDGHVFTSGPNGGGEVRLTRGSGNLDPVWSPDGKRIAYDRGFRDIWVMGARGGNKHKVVSSGIQPAWSPDGRRLAFTRLTASGGALLVKNLRTGAVRRVVAPTRRWHDAVEAAWSPNGRWIAFARTETPRGAPPQDDLFKVHPDGTGLTRLTSGGIDQSDPTWSPDGRRIAYVNGGLASTGALRVMRADGRGVRTVLDMPGNEFSPSWSPDGTRIVLSSTGDEPAPPGAPRPPHEGLWTVGPDGSDPTYVVRDGLMPDWQARP